MKIIQIILTILSINFTFLSCEKKAETEEEIVAKVGDSYLYKKDIEHIVPNATNSEDSAIIANDYIKKWVKLQLTVLKAEENLSAEQKDLEKEILEYRNSLIIYKYKNELVKQRMDTTVSEIDIENYYDRNIDNFVLNNNIVKATYVKIPVDIADEEKLKLYCENTTDEGVEFLNEYCLQFAKKYDIFVDNWVNLNLFTDNFDTVIDNEPKFLKNNRMLEETDSLYYSLLVIHDYTLRGESAPKEYVQSNIKTLILNKRKIEFLKDVERDIYEEGIRKNKFTIYN